MVDVLMLSGRTRAGQCHRGTPAQERSPPVPAPSWPVPPRALSVTAGGHPPWRRSDSPPEGTCPGRSAASTTRCASASAVRMAYTASASGPPVAAACSISAGSAARRALSDRNRVGARHRPSSQPSEQRPDGVVSPAPSDLVAAPVVRAVAADEVPPTPGCGAGISGSGRSEREDGERHQGGMQGPGHHRVSSPHHRSSGSGMDGTDAVHHGRVRSPCESPPISI